MYKRQVIGSHECVFDCAVVGLPDDKWGEKVAAVIIRKPGLDESKINEDTIRECCKSQMAGFKRPKEIIFIDEDEMPRTPTGKILHRKLREKFRKYGGPQNGIMRAMPPYMPGIYPIKPA